MNNLIKIFIVSLLCSSLYACKAVKVVEVPVEKIRIQREVEEKRDSIYVRDSVLHIIKGDTVFIERWHTRYKETVRTDTVQSTDTVTQVVHVEVPVEVNTLSWWQNILMYIGAVAFILIVYKFTRLWN